MSSMAAETPAVVVITSIVTPITSSGPAYSPLTTPFTPPSWCSSEYNVYYTYSGSTTPYPYLLRDISCGADGSAVLATECFPPAIRFPGITAWGADVVYSPAVGCPVGWRTLRDDGPAVSSTPGATTGTRVYACCPDSFPSTYAGYCSSSITLGTGRASAYSCDGSEAVEVPITPVSSSSVYIVNAMRILLVVDNATPYGSFATPTPSTSSSRRSASSIFPTATTAGGITGSNDQPLSGESPKKKVSPGAIAGSVIGSLAAVLALLALFFIIRRKKRNSDTSSDAPELVSTTFGTDKPGAKAPYDTSVPSAGTQPEYMPVNTNSPTQPYHAGAHGIPVYTPSIQQPYTSYSPSGSVVSALHAPELVSPAVSQRPYSNVTSTTAFSSPTLPYGSEVGSGERNSMSEVARLEADKAVLEERIARMKSVAAMEEEQERVRRRIEGLRSGGGG